MVSIPRDWFDYTNSSVGGIGLLLTVLAIVQATSAKAAARKAEQSVLRHNAESDFISLARMAKDLHVYVEIGKLPEARLRTTDLRSELATALTSHGSFLGVQDGKLRDNQLQLKLFADGLNRGLNEISLSEQIRLAKITGAILDVLAGQSGELRSRPRKD